MPRRPPLREVGTDPDYRFTLANERTFLAWIRTSLALLAGGVALLSLTTGPGRHTARQVLGVLLIGFSAVLAAASYRRWERAERAIRLGQALPPTTLTRLVAGGIAVVVVAVLAVALLA